MRNFDWVSLVTAVSPKRGMLRRQRRYVLQACGPSNDVFFIQITKSDNHTECVGRHTHQDSQLPVVPRFLSICRKARCPWCRACLSSLTSVCGVNSDCLRMTRAGSKGGDQDSSVLNKKLNDRVSKARLVEIECVAAFIEDQKGVVFLCEVIHGTFIVDHLVVAS